MQVSQNSASLDPNAGYITTVNIYTVAPENAEAVLNLLIKGALETLRHLPGFNSANFHISADRTEVLNYGQWASQEAIAGAFAHPDTASGMRQVAALT